MSEDLKHLIGKKFRTVGYEKYTAEIIYINSAHPEYPVVALVTGEDGFPEPQMYTKDLKFYVGEDPDLMDLVEIKPYEDFKIDDPVACWMDSWAENYPNLFSLENFAKVSENGKPMTFANGRTSFTNKYSGINAPIELVEWDHCISKEEYENNQK